MNDQSPVSSKRMVTGLFGVQNAEGRMGTVPIPQQALPNENHPHSPPL